MRVLVITFLMLVSGVLYAILATCTLIKSWRIFAPGEAQSSLFHPKPLLAWKSCDENQRPKSSSSVRKGWSTHCGYYSLCVWLGLCLWLTEPRSLWDVVFWEGAGRHSPPCCFPLVIGGALSVARWGLPQVSCCSQAVWDLGPTHSLCWVAIHPLPLAPVTPTLDCGSSVNSSSVGVDTRLSSECVALGLQWLSSVFYQPGLDLT